MAKSIKLNAFYKSILSILNILFPLITAPYIARVLSVEGFTEYNRAASMIAWFSPFAVFGIYTYGLREISKIRNNKKAVEELFTSLFSLSILFSLIVTICYFFIVVCFSELRYRILYSFASLQVLFVCFATDWMNEAGEKYGFILIKSFLCRLFYVISVFVFIHSENDAWIYMLLSSLSVVLNNLLTFCYNKINYKFTRLDIKKTAKFIKPLFIVFLLVNSSMLYTLLDRFALTYFGNKIELTYYHISQLLSNSVVQIASSIILVTIPRLSFYWGNNKKEEYYNLLEKSSSLFSCISIPCCAGMAYLASEIMYLYAGEKYIAGAFPFFLFCFRYLISNFDSILAKQILLATGNEKCLTRIYYIGGIYNVFIKSILIILGKLSAVSCIISTTSADILVIILQMIQIKKFSIRNKTFNKNLIIPFIVSMCFIFVIWPIRNLFPALSLWYAVLRCFISIVICGFFYFSVLFITKNKVLLDFIKGVKK